MGKPSSLWKSLRGPLLGALIGFLACFYCGLGDLSTFKSDESRRVLNEVVEPGEHGHDEEHHDPEEEYEEHVKVSESVTVIVLVLIIMTISFEEIKEYIEELADRNTKPIIQSLFGEMTVLGFLSVVTFTISKAGIFELISIHVFGEEEEEAELEIFEAVHFGLFFVMIFFVILVMFVVQESLHTQKEYLAMERICRTAKYEGGGSYQNGNNSEHLTNSGILSKCTKFLGKCIPCFNNSKYDYLDNQRAYDALRNEFILERSSDPPFAPADEANRVPEDFNFGLYLSICLSRNLAHVVHLDIIAWVSLAIFMIIFFLITLAAKMDMEIISWVWVGVGWIILILCTMFHDHMQDIKINMAGIPSNSSNTDPERQNLLNGESTLPEWTKIDLDEYVSRRSWLTRYLSKVAPNRQDSLFWFERRGPHYCAIGFQLVIIFDAVYCAILAMTFLPAMYKETNIQIFLIYLAVAAVPVVVLKQQRRHLAAVMGQISCVGIHRKPQVIATVIREEKTARVVRAFLILVKMQQAAGGELELTTTNTENQVHYSELLGPVELTEASKTFDQFDNSGDGSIDSSELRNIMASLGAPLDEENLSKMVRALDRNSDGEISKDEFLQFYAEHIAFTGESDSGIHERAHQMFRMFDQSGDGEITIGEFKSSLDAFNVGMSYDDVGNLIRELDEHENGTLGEHEFHNLLKKYEPLLRDYSPKRVD